MNPVIKNVGQVAGRIAGAVAVSTVAMFTTKKVTDLEVRYRARSMKKLAKVYREDGKGGLKLYLLTTRICVDSTHADMFIDRIMPAIDKINEIESKKDEVKAAEKAAKAEKKEKKREAKKAAREARA